MKIYLLSLGAGLLVGIVYSLLNVRSPAPPVVALVGLLGILIGEQMTPFARMIWSGAVSRNHSIRPPAHRHLSQGIEGSEDAANQVTRLEKEKS